MAKVIFTISYEINPEKREEYLALSQEMKAYIQSTNGKEYSIYEHKGKKNFFSEVFVFDSVEDYNQLDDQDDRINEMVLQLEPLLVDKRMKYNTLVELE